MKTISNFTLKKEVELEHIKSTGYLYKHKNGAQFVFVKNDDRNKVFYVSFKTLPDNDKGTAHVLEHCTLCGSKKYPLKDTFNEVASSSLYTYLNAITFKDKTVYPLASMYEDELIKLIDIYMDCAFNPLLRLETFLHEAWHYEKSQNDLDVNGIVYSEMKSAFSNPVRETRSFIHRKLFPDTSYQFESAGIPKKILTLQHDELFSFHKKYYSPQNCFLYLYGDIDSIENYLQMFDSYLSKDDSQKIIIPHQDSFNKPQIANTLYDYSGAQKKYFGAGFVVGTKSDAELAMSFKVLNSYLTKTVGSPLKRFLPLVKTFFEDEIYQPVYSVLSENFNGSTERFMETIYQIFKHIHKNGLNKSLLDSCINNLEFEFKANFHKYRPNGLVYGLSILNNLIYSDEPFLNIDSVNILNRLRKKISNGYFDQLIDNFIIKNKHAIFVSLIPDSKNKFEFIPNNVDMVNSQAMRKFIESEETHPDLIKLADTSETIANDFDKIIDRSTDKAKILHTQIDTQDIIYLCFNFRTDCVAESYIHYVGVLAEILTFLGIENNSNKDIQMVMNNIGNMQVSIETYSKDNFSYIPCLNIKVKLFASNINEIINIVHSIFTIKSFDSKSLIKKILMQKFAKMNNEYTTKPIWNVTQKINSYICDEYKYRDCVEGFSFYFFLKDLLSDFDNEYDNLISGLSSIFKKIFTQQNSLLHITCDKKTFVGLYERINKLMTYLPSREQQTIEYFFRSYKSNEAFFNLASINTNGLIIPLDNFEVCGYADVFENFMNRIYLMQQIRIKGGAYNSVCKFKDGRVYFYSYADPNIKLSYEKFLSAADFTINFNFTERDFKKCVISAINNFDKPKSAEERANISLTRYITNTTEEDIKKIRSQIMSANENDIKKIALQIKGNLNKAMVCTIGNRTKIFETKEIFSSITKL